MQRELEELYGKMHMEGYVNSQKEFLNKIYEFVWKHGNPALRTVLKARICGFNYSASDVKIIRENLDKIFAKKESVEQDKIIEKKERGMQKALEELYGKVHMEGYVNSQEDFLRKIEAFLKNYRSLTWASQTGRVYGYNYSETDVKMVRDNLDKIFKEKISVEQDKIAQKKGESKMRKVTIKTEEQWNSLVDELMYPSVFDLDEKEEEITISNLELLETNVISVPSKMDLYEGLDITEKDRNYVSFEQGTQCWELVLFVNGDDHVVGTFHLEKIKINEKCKFVLVADALNLFFEGHDSSKYFFVFCNVKGTLIKVPIDVSFQKTKVTNAHLCIDFGTSNTTAGCFLADNYVDNISNIAVINHNVYLNAENIVTFDEWVQEDNGYDSLQYRSIVPTIVYVEDCSDPEYIKYLIGYQASEQIKLDKYCPEASCFMEIKRWTSNIDVCERIQDADGNTATVSRREILSKYIMYIIKTAENQFKCKFKNIHISAPVKLKDKILKIYADILEEQGYVLEQDHAIDEGVAVLYSIIDTQIKERTYKNGENEKALIIDCGGGTSDLASCNYKIEKDEDGIINLDIETAYMNGDMNFGGNNLTYRIMQYMKIVYANQISGKTGRINIDNLITHDVNSLFSYIEGDLTNEDNEKVKERYEDVYTNINQSYIEAEKVIPTKYSEYENKPKEIYDKVKNNFYFFWKLAEEMKKEFYKSTSISRYKYGKGDSANTEIDLHVTRIEEWRLSIIGETGTLTEQPYPDVTFTAKEIDKLLRADIYYLVRKFLNDLYADKKLDEFSQIKLSGQSSKINIFMDSLKEFLPGKKIKSGRFYSRGNDAEELKLVCLKGAIMYLHALEKSNIEVNLKNETKIIPITVFIKNENDEDKVMFDQGTDWNQPARKRRITSAGKEVYLYMKNADKEVCDPYKYVYENAKYCQTTFDELQKMSGNRIQQADIDTMAIDKKYLFVCLDKEQWGFKLLILYRDDKGKLYKGNEEFCSFEMDILQETFFDGKR